MNKTSVKTEMVAKLTKSTYTPSQDNLALRSSRSIQEPPV